MTSSETFCLRWRLYAIIDAAACGGRDLAEVAAAAIRGGADVLQLRHKGASARELVPIARRLMALAGAGGVPLLINDRIDVAALTDASGVHLGQEDAPVAEARRQLGPRCLIGKSTHSLEQALAAQKQGADYIGFGPLFPTPTKPDARSVGLEQIAEVTSRVHLPVVCIGGIDAETLPRVVSAGARCVAVVRAVCDAEDPESAARTLKRTLTQFVRTASPASL